MTEPKTETPDKPGDTPPPAPTPSRTPPGLRNAQKAAKHKTWADHIDVLKFVERAAEDMKTQKTIAAWLGKTIRQLEEAMAKEKGDNKLRLAYENGRARAEQKHIDAGHDLSPTNPKEMVAWIFFMKAQFGWRDKPDTSSTDAPKITFVLPGPMSEADYLAKCGITAPIDTRTDAQKGLLGGMKDVTPGADGKLPTKVTTGTSAKLDVAALAATKSFPLPASPVADAASLSVIQQRVRELTTRPAEPFKPKLD